MRLTSGFSVGKSGMALFSSPSSHRSQSSIQAHQHERDRWRVMRINHRIKATAPSCPAPPIKPKWLTASGRLFWTPERCFEHFEKEKRQSFAWKSTVLINSVFVSTLHTRPSWTLKGAFLSTLHSTALTLTVYCLKYALSWLNEGSFWRPSRRCLLHPLSLYLSSLSTRVRMHMQRPLLPHSPRPFAVHYYWIRIMLVTLFGRFSTQNRIRRRERSNGKRENRSIDNAFEAVQRILCKVTPPNEPPHYLKDARRVWAECLLCLSCSRDA